MNIKMTPLLPESDAREAALFFVVAALCFLAVLATLVARGTYTAAEAWTAQVEGEMTVLVSDTDRRGAESAATLIEALPGVERAHVLTDEELDELLSPSFGPGGIPDGIPLPLLIAVDAEGDTTALAAEIDTTLAEAGINGRADTHSAYAAEVRKALGTLRIAAIGTVLLLTMTAISVIAFATHAALLARKDIVDVLHLAGAEDRFIARLFERRFWLLGLKAGAAGSVAALAVTAIIVFSAQSSNAPSELLPKLSLDQWDLMILAVSPIAGALAARIAARVTVGRSLRSSL
ncbi:MAG TPA: cell division protein FtsX [Henriciella marina]|uniref:cell division protein FtsX n=1 Tax=Henriciella sp. TaxID=1968823 RepID=UPI00182604AB|nr:cell division protein FtsX [Henriciella sp.]HIG21364.1 cell division protein FtsX [Henriciella sp.]HIK64479.1 cell division protein FtsX [Henriciella marina]